MRPTVRHAAALAAALMILAALAVPVAAKEWLEATLDAPIAMGTPPGTEILVGVTVLVPGDDNAMHPVDGSPIRLILTGRDGSSTYAAGAADGKPGHYLMRIAIPPGGARGAQVVMHGTSDLPLRLTADPFTFGGVTSRTAQVAPPLSPRLTPFPQTGAVALPPEPGPADEPASAPAPAFPSAPALLALVTIAALAGATIVRLRRSRAGRRTLAAGRVPGA